MRPLTTSQSLDHGSKGLCSWGSQPDEPEQSCSAPRPAQVRTRAVSCCPLMTLSFGPLFSLLLLGVINALQHTFILAHLQCKRLLGFSQIIGSW